MTGRQNWTIYFFFVFTIFREEGGGEGGGPKFVHIHGMYLKSIDS